MADEDQQSLTNDLMNSLHLTFNSPQLLVYILTQSSNFQLSHRRDDTIVWFLLLPVRYNVTTIAFVPLAFQR
jgi:hypothetical protein